MNPQLEAQILAASQPLRVPGSGEQRILAPAAVGRLAESGACARWEVEATALEMEIVPLHYLRNLSRFGRDGQVRLLRAQVAVVGEGPVAARAMELLGLDGIGRIRVLVPAGAEELPEARRAADRLADAGRNRNQSSVVESGVIRLKAGNPAEALAGVEAVAATLTNSMDEQLLQAACRMAKLPLVLGAAEERWAQATTILPGDPGVVLLYKPTHPHLEPGRSARADDHAILTAANWLAEQTTSLLLGREGLLLRHTLRYLDLDRCEVRDYPLAR